MPLSDLMHVLHYKNAEECVEFVQQHGGVLVANNDLDCKASVLGIQTYEANVVIVK
jgi:hypothetical protein